MKFINIQENLNLQIFSPKKYDGQERGPTLGFQEMHQLVVFILILMKFAPDLGFFST